MRLKTITESTFTEFATRNQIIWLKPKQVAKLMQCSLQHVYDLAKSGKISYIRDGKNVRFKPDDLDQYEKQSLVRRLYHGTVQKRQQF
jgi:excisionase family DNA binding protein